MYLKNLTVLGFKSFADKTSLNFQPGVTAIVGPNGCGKSNVSDAIRWVLGEQSAKALRGGEMADVIFNGTDGRKPLSMAEVSLTIGGVDGEHLSAAGVEIAYNEVTLTRRVFRDGSSEYFLNKTPCRLKDIQQLFMGTGVGRTSYSIMAQGNITQILSSKPEDRRIIFEEAAGITKFKAQKKEALRKLEATDQNLLRVADLIREVKRQIGSLQRQAGKARRYKQLMTELQHLDTQLARHQFDVLQTDIRERSAQLEKWHEEIATLSETVLRVENEISVLREELSEQEQAISHLQQQGMELKGQSDRHESRIQFNEDKLRDLEAQNTRATSDIAQAEERKLAAEEELRSVLERYETAAASLREHQQAFETKRQALQALESEAHSGQEALRTAQSRAFEAAQQLGRARNEITALDLRKEGNAVRLEKLSAEKIQLEEERRGLETRLQQFSATVEADILNAQTHRGTVEDRQQRLREIQQQLNETMRELDELLRKQAEKRSRLNVLEQLQAEHEGFGTGALSALKNATHVLGSLADKIRVPDQYVVAIETALGHNLQLVLTEQPETARQIVEDLRTNKTGRASVAALNLTPANGDSSVPAPADLIGALGVIESEPAVQPLLRRLLGQTLIAPDLAAAVEGCRNTGGAFDFVTPDGDLLNRHGIFTGGYLNGHGSGQAAASILGRKNQIAELQTAVGALQETVNDASRRKGALMSEQTQLQAGLQTAQTELRTQEVAIATNQGEFKAMENSARSLGQKIETVVYEIGSLANQEEEGARKRQGLAEQAGALETREQEQQAAVTQLTTSLENLRQQREAANASLTETKVALATQDQLCNSFGSQRRPLEQRIAELTHLAAQRRAEIASFLERKLQAENEIAESRQKIEGISHQREQINVQVTEMLSQKGVIDERIATADGGLREQRRLLSDLQQQRGAVEVELAQKEMATQNLRDRIREKHQVALDGIRSECITITLADEGPAQVHTLTPEEMAQSGAATDWDAVAGQVAALQTRIDEMGPVNLVAIAEYEETEQRHQFLTKQNDDLVQAKTQLVEVINRINTQTRQMFIETFEKIRDNFRLLFVEIFGGGKADLILSEEGDVLECGIDIVARPPGKQLQSISLLSGGEQTMTAVALLFSIYQVKPSPFCVLDELDAPLDESNINRFVRVLQRFLVHSQFVIITHNKRTIGMADVLYGVTMQEHGVSKIVSVKFHKTEDASNGNGDGNGNGHAAPAQSESSNGDSNGGAMTPAREETIVMAK
ncbi:MAG TPA: chromosome segregation protein SMC [Verrucomicrobiae bacterium]|jgi:chromosome segregation protein|nr:chromosome segregation protein SMC [Verrucomicrobiae bacterium]